MLQIVVALAVGLSGPVPYLPDSFVTTCEGEQATGFVWRDGSWVRATFLTSKYVITKGAGVYCGRGDDYSADIIYGSAEYTSKFTCLNIRKAGESFEPTGKPCAEYYSREKGGPIQIAISCGAAAGDRFVLNPYGRFQKSVLHGDVSDKPLGDYKDSIFLEVGRCSMTP